MRVFSPRIDLAFANSLRRWRLRTGFYLNPSAALIGRNKTFSRYRRVACSQFQVEPIDRAGAATLDDVGRESQVLDDACALLGSRPRGKETDRYAAAVIRGRHGVGIADARVLQSPQHTRLVRGA